MRLSTCKSEAMVFNRKRVAWWKGPASRGRVSPGLVQDWGKVEYYIDRQIGAVMWSVYQSIVLTQKATISIYWSVYAPILSCGHELWGVTRRSRMHLQVAKMSFLGRVDMRYHRGRVRSLVTWEEFGVQPLFLCSKRSEQRWLGYLFQMPPVHLPREAFEACPTGRKPHQRLGKNRRDYVSQLALEHLGILLEEQEEIFRVKESGHLCLDCCSHTVTMVNNTGLLSFERVSQVTVKPKFISSKSHRGQKPGSLSDIRKFQPWMVWMVSAPREGTSLGGDYNT